MEAKLPPHSIDAEQQTLGALLSDAKGWVHVADVLTAEDFYREDHRLIFEAIATLADAGHAHDLVTVPEWLRNHGYSDRAPASYVGDMALSTGSAANIRAYAEIVRDKAKLRGLIAAADEMQTVGFADDGTPVEDKLDAAEQSLSQLSERSQNAGFVSALDACRKSVARLERRMNGEAMGLSTGFVDLDRMTSGLQDGQLTVIAARPSMGKSAVSGQLAYHAALAGHKTLVFSLEMPEVDITDRQLSAMSRVPFEHIYNGKMQEADWPDYSDAMSQIKDAPIDICDMPGINARGIRTMARRTHMRQPVRLIVIDYLQLITVRDASRNRAESVNEITTGLKQLARELKCPIVLLSQLNRECEKRNDKRPQLSDLRESGGIEQDADNVIFLYRDEVYHEETPHEGVAELLVRKQRNGPIGSVDLQWDAAHVCFHNHAGPSKQERQAEWDRDHKTVKKGDFEAKYAERAYVD